MSLLPKIGVATCDPRDLAQCIMNACSDEKIKNERFLLSNETIWLEEMAKELKELLGDAYQGPTKVSSYLNFRYEAFNDLQLQQLVPFWGKEIRFDCSKARNLLGFEPNPLKKSLQALVESFSREHKK